MLKKILSLLWSMEGPIFYFVQFHTESRFKKRNPLFKVKVRVVLNRVHSQPATFSSILRAMAEVNFSF